MKKILLLSMLLILPVVIASEEYVACTQDAKLCPDGTYVSRVPPNCDFAPCPEKPNCLEDSDLQTKIDDCMERGVTYYRSIDSFGCPTVVCGDEQCPTDSDKNKMMMGCREQGKGYKFYVDTSGCTQVECTNQNATCGNGIVEQGERCDGANLDGKSCISFPNFVGGAIKCTPDCMFDLSSCMIMIDECGTGRLTTHKQCDGNNLGNATCISLGYTGGTLTCTNNCMFNISGCTKGSTSPCANLPRVQCEAQGMQPEVTINEQGCEILQCVATSRSCSGVQEIESQIQACKNQNKTAQVYTDNATGCRHVDCVDRICASDLEMQKKIALCKAAGIGYQTFPDESGCRQVKCNINGTVCPAPQALYTRIEACKSQGLSYEVVELENCKQVRCKNPERKQVVSCKKLEEANCTAIRCTDGYSLNTCEPNEFNRLIECTRIRDDEGCIVKSCTNGYEEKRCRQKQTVCQVYNREDGCQVKKCSDGKELVRCPEEKCVASTNPEGCTVTECGKERTVDCPEKEPMECKVFIDQQGCETKECTNGFRSSSCEAPNECEEKVVDGCKVTECADGTIKRYCSGETSVECVTFESVDIGCKFKACTDGFSEKVCEGSENSLTAEQKQGLFSAIGRMLASIFS